MKVAKSVVLFPRKTCSFSLSASTKVTVEKLTGEKIIKTQKRAKTVLEVLEPQIK